MSFAGSDCSELEAEYLRLLAENVKLRDGIRRADLAIKNQQIQLRDVDEVAMKLLTEVSEEGSEVPKGNYRYYQGVKKVAGEVNKLINRRKHNFIEVIRGL